MPEKNLSGRVKAVGLGKRYQQASQPPVHVLEDCSFEIEPVRLLKLRFQPGYYRTFGGADPTATVYGFLLGALYPIKSWLTARLDYRFAYQKQADTTLPHNIVTLSLDVVYPVRIAP
jgi:hypothetical protein